MPHLLVAVLDTVVVAVGITVFGAPFTGSDVLPGVGLAGRAG